MRLTRARAALVAALVGLLVVAVPSPAFAVEPPPGPVDEILDIPSRVVKSATGSPIGDTVMMMLRGQRWSVGGGAVVPVAEPAVKPLTAPATFTRGVGSAAGSTILGASYLAGWGLGTGGLYLYGAVTGTDAYEGYCRLDDQGLGWLQEVHGAINFGIQPGCYGQVATPNTDVTLAEMLSYGGLTMTYWGLSSGGVYCYDGNYAARPAGSSLRWFALGGGWFTSGLTAHSSCGGKLASGAHPGNVTGPAIQLVTSTGTVLAQSSTSSADPTRTPRCSIEWENGSTTTGTGTPYKESEGLPLSAAGLGCQEAYVSQPGRGPALLPSRIGVESENDDTGAITEISEAEVPDFAPDERRAFETGNGRGLVLEKVTGLLTSSCMTWAADCSGWWTATSSGTNPTTGGSTYRCTYAGNQISLVECGAYRNTFDTQTQTPTITDPATGNQADWSAQPSTGNSINPGTGPGTGASPAASCYETGWAEVANPIDWVLVPVKCALVWAFVPRTSVTTAAQAATQTAWTESTPGQLQQALTAVTPAIAALNNGSCGGLILPYPEVGAGWSVEIHNGAVLAACPGDFFAPWAPWFFWFISASLAIGGFFGIKGMLDRFVGL